MYWLLLLVGIGVCKCCRSGNDGRRCRCRGRDNDIGGIGDIGRSDRCCRRSR